MLNEYIPVREVTPQAYVPTQSLEKKYTEEDVLLLIKFIVKEFAKIIQKWTFTNNPCYPTLGFNNTTQTNINSLLLASLLNRENATLQAQEAITQNLLQQVNPKSLIDMLHMNRFKPGSSTLFEQPKAGSIPTNTHSSAPTKVVESKENVDDIKMQENEPEPKDEVDTILSSEDKSGRYRSISEDTTAQTKKVDLDQAYAFLNNPSILGALLKNFPSSN